MDDWDKHEVLLHFEHRGRPVQLRASAAGWATLWLKENPLSYRARKSEHERRQEALRQGHLAVSSILRDWIKGQVTAIETSILSFEAVFLPHMLTHDGRPLIERARELLPEPTELWNLVVARDGDEDWSVGFRCPCGCGQRLEMMLLKEVKPRWDVSVDRRGYVSLHPSVWLREGCKSHFWVRLGRIVWCE
jgi:Family of unknown function (DUF6527)